MNALPLTLPECTEKGRADRKAGELRTNPYQRTWRLNQAQTRAWLEGWDREDAEIKKKGQN